ncbi:uncharacterized protein JCM15063_003873 [Sporobolomyces koalae]|uniref:uncharacterized protein n=1 Tax=Sporobolomyces koalae TaxID=500713 RepID=UPI003174A620
MSNLWNDIGNFTDQSLNPSTFGSYDPIDGSYGPTTPALQQQQQQQQDAYNEGSMQDHISVHDSPMTSYSNSGPMRSGSMDYANSMYDPSGSVNPAATMDLDYDMSGVDNVVGLPVPAVAPRHDPLDLAPARSTSMTGIERRASNAQYGSTSAAEAFARLRAGSISITPSSAPSNSNGAMGDSAKVLSSAHSGRGQVQSHSRGNSISDLPMRAFSYPAQLPLASHSSPRKTFSTHHRPSLHLTSPLPSAFPQYAGNSTGTPYETSAGPTYDMYGTAADTAFSLNEGGLAGFNSGIVPPSQSVTPTPETFKNPPATHQQHHQHRHQRANSRAGSYLQHAQPAPQPQPPPSNLQNQPAFSDPSLYSSSGFDLIGVLARVVGRKNPIINVGSIDMSCSFIVADAKDPEMSSIYVSETFCKLTGYNQEEIVGRSCRFLQAPGDQPVRKGEKRRYTDTSAAHHLATKLDNLQECQVSLINYQKGGKPFINLVTCIPISWNYTDEIDYIVGFQVDLVDQPAAILDKMTNGSYVVNYSVVHATIARNPSISSTEIASAIEQLEDTVLAGSNAQGQQLIKPDPSSAIQSVRDQVTTTDLGEVIDLVAKHGLPSVANDAIRKQFMRLMVDQCDDLIHVLSLKGALLYVSPAARNLLEYEPSELLGKTLASFCHPSDIVSVQRELKDAGIASHANVNLVYRIRRKHSGYMWFEASGRLHLEQGKGRKCVILSGRPKEVYKMSWSDLERAGGMGESEFWAKVCVDGIFLTATRSLTNVLGNDPKFSIVGRSFADLSPDRDSSGIMQALLQAAEGKPAQVQHQMMGANGPVEVVTHFYPARSDQEEPTSPTLPAVGRKQVSVIAQINLLSSEMTKSRTPLSAFKSVRSGSQSDASSSMTMAGVSTAATGSSVGGGGGNAGVTLALPAFGGRPSGTTPSSTSAGSSFSAVPSTFKALASPNATSDNVFEELNVTRGTSWQFELHQMRLTNKKLREEKEALSALKRKREESVKPPSSTKGSNAPRACANCGRTTSAEWRSGPTGPKTLCNACGLRWSKARSQAQAADVKKKADAAATLPPQHFAKKHSSANETSDDSPYEGSRESSSSTNPTTNSPASQVFAKAFSPRDLQAPPPLLRHQSVFASSPYGDTVAPPPPPPHHSYHGHPPY